MKKVLRIVFVILLLLLGSAICFYWWARQPMLTTRDHITISVDSSLMTVDSVRNDQASFSIMTYNLGYLSGMTNNRAVERNADLFKENLAKAISFFEQQSPDIIAFQEIDYGSARSYEVDQETSIADAMHYAYRARAVNWDKRYVAFPYWPPSAHFGKIIGGQSVISRYSITEQKIDTLARVEAAPFFYRDFYLERLAQICSLRIDQQEVIVINVHLEAFDRPTREKHMARVRELYLQYASDFPTILLGDFNSSPDEIDATIQPLLDEKLGIRSVDLAWGNLAYSFDSESPHSRLDYIFYNDKLELIDGSVLAIAGAISDHLPVQATFQLRKKEVIN